jgi:F-type H+-transporting ATPase subunit a
MILALPPIVAEPILHIGTFPVTNAYINSTLAVLFFLVIGFLLKNRTSMKPKGFQNFAEGTLEWILGFIDQVTRDRKKSMKFMPVIGGMFLFILFSNWIGLVPGTGSIGRYLTVHGETELVPLFRPANADLNMTLAMSVFAVVSAHLLGIFTIGFFKYANKFIKIGDLIGSFKKGGVSVMAASIEFVIGLIETFLEAAKIASLSFRLFGNIFAGEVLLTVITGLVGYVVPLPFMFLEVLVGIIQATVFSLLTLVYLTMATAPIHGHGEEHKHKEPIPAQ